MWTRLLSLIKVALLAEILLLNVACNKGYVFEGDIPTSGITNTTPYIISEKTLGGQNWQIGSTTDILVFNDKIYTADYSLSHIVSYDLDLNFIQSTKFTQSTEADHFHGPKSIRISDGKLKVLDNFRIHTLNENLEFLSEQLHSQVGSTDFIYTDAGNYVFARRSPNRFFETDTSFNSIWSINLTDANAIELDTDGNWLVSDLTSINKYNSSTRVLMSTFSNYNAITYATNDSIFANVNKLFVDPVAGYRIVNDMLGRNILFNSLNTYIARLPNGGASTIHNSHIYTLTPNGIIKMDLNGNVVASYLSKGDTENLFKGTTASHFSFNKKLFVLDSGSHAVKIYDDQGNFLHRIGRIDGTSSTADGEFDGIEALKTDREGNIYVYSSGSCRFQIFDSDYNFIRKFGSCGTGDSQFGWISHFEVDENKNIYVLDSEYSRFQKFSFDGTHQGSFVFPDLEYNSGFTLSNNKFYVNDIADECLIKIYDLNFTQVSSFGTCGALEGEFLSTEGYSWLIDTDREGNIYIDETTWGKGGVIKKFSQTGEYLGMIDLRSEYYHLNFFSSSFEIDHHHNVISITDSTKANVRFKTLP